MLSTWKSFLRFLPSLCVIVTVVAFVSCDSSGRVYLNTIQFDRMQIVSATPVKRVNDRWVPACRIGDTPEAVRIAFNLKSSLREVREGNEPDNDLQIRPDEDPVGAAKVPAIVQIGSTLGVNSIDLNVECIKSHDATATPSNQCAGGVATPSVAVETDEALNFHDNLLGNQRGTTVGVAFLMDMSGSHDGLVDHATINGQPSCYEAKDGTYTPASGTIKCVSDSANFRATALEKFINSMNARDPLIVFGQNEEDPFNVFCDVPGLLNEDKGYLVENCYNTDRRLTLGTGVSPTGVPLDDGGPAEYLASGEKNPNHTVRIIDSSNYLINNTKGRSNLWAGVSKTYEFMMDKPQVAKHIIVFADGPDTCHEKSDSFRHCFKKGFVSGGETIPGTPKKQGQCGGARAYDDVRSEIESYMKLQADNGEENKIHISFIHYQAQGAPEMDPRMQEIACMTGGHYIFLNYNVLTENSDDRKNEILEAVEKIRYSMSGHWGYVVDIPTYQNIDDTQSGPGLMYQLKGYTKLTSPELISDLKANQEFQAFGVGTQLDPTVSAAGLADHRLPIRKACVENGCGGDPANPCDVRCSPETGLCAPPAPGSVCSLNGAPGVCCSGTCKTDAGAQGLCSDSPTDCP